MDWKALEGRAAQALAGTPGVEAVVLGGSRATGTAEAGSDLDVGVYYRRERLDWDRLNAAARILDDEHREDLVCREGGWGPWVNCGGWLVMEGVHTDLILRDLDRVAGVLDETDRGEVSANDQTGHPHAYLNVMYRGELAACRPLWTDGGRFIDLKARAEIYPEPMRRALMSKFGFEMDFSAQLARKALASGDLSYICGNLYRAVACMNQVLFALNRAWCLNEKRAAVRIERLDRHPFDYARRVQEIFALPGERGIDALDGLRAEARALMEQSEN